MPKVDGSFSSLVEPQLGHDTEDVAENISRSKRSPQLTHLNSNTGTWTLLCQARPTIYPRFCVLDSTSVPLHDSLSAILVGRLYQILLLWTLAQEIGDLDVSGSADQGTDAGHIR